ncbi:MAG TPA: phosphate signaling complex protein PhoU, partial [Alphaproteobacteria bacterium]|nr:phosphate signaling complex protein PhoU [Alphaproteobacteria bacterium]
MPESNQSGEHIVRAYDEQLDNLTAMVTRMGGLAETQLAAAIRAVLQRDSELAHKVVAGDEQIDDLDQEIDGAVIRLLALRQPMAVDLRAVLTALRISADLERVGDYAKNVAKRALVLNQEHVTAPADGIRRMGEIA